MRTDIDTLEFNSGKAGKNLLVFGAIHGNETCGTVGIGRVIAELRSGIFSLSSGTLTLAPICNPAAYAANKRFVDENLNRVIRKHATPTAYEHHLANTLTGLIDKADALLDLHSYSGGSKPFLFLDSDTEEHRLYAAALGIEDWVTGWNEAYAEAPASLSGGDTVSYAHSMGKDAVLVECSGHTDPAGAVTAYNSIRAALAYFNMTDALAAVPPQARLNKISSIIVRQKEGRYTKDWQHLDTVEAGEVVATYTDGETIVAPHKGTILLPDRNAGIGQEWLYFGSL